MHLFHGNSSPKHVVKLLQHKVASQTFAAADLICLYPSSDSHALLRSGTSLKTNQSFATKSVN